MRQAPARAARGARGGYCVAQRAVPRAEPRQCAVPPCGPARVVQGSRFGQGRLADWEHRMHAWKCEVDVYMVAYTGGAGGRGSARQCLTG
eukprot:2469459-Prorocentrum_lima.AAC.1